MRESRHSNFWRLRAPESQEKLAKVSADVTYGGVTCPVNPDHQRAGPRTSDLTVILPDKIDEDFVWTWFSDCLITGAVLEAFRDEKVSGFETKPVRARFETKRNVAPKLWELVVTGWGGMASRESGIHLDREKSCHVCGHLVYTGLIYPEKLIDENQWDGSDLFMVWPFPGVIFVTERVVRLLDKFQFSGVSVTPGSALDIEDDEEISPGRLSYSMPEPRAREIGRPLGIY